MHRRLPFAIPVVPGPRLGEWRRAGLHPGKRILAVNLRWLALPVPRKSRGSGYFRRSSTGGAGRFGSGLTSPSVFARKAHTLPNQTRNSFTRMSVECQRRKRKRLHTDCTSRLGYPRHNACLKTVATDSLKSFIWEHVSWQCTRRPMITPPNCCGGATVPSSGYRMIWYGYASSRSYTVRCTSFLPFCDAT